MLLLYLLISRNACEENESKSLAWEESRNRNVNIKKGGSLWHLAIVNNAAMNKKKIKKKVKV